MIEGLLKYYVADADATGVAHDNIDEILAGNRKETLEKDIAMHGSIGPTPYIQTEEGQQALMDIVMGSAGPGLAIGRVSKASVTGGQSIGEALKSWLKKHKGQSSPPSHIPTDMAQQWHMTGKMPKGAIKKAEDMMESVPPMQVPSVDKIIHENKLSRAQLALMKIREKAGMPFQPFHWDKGHHMYKPETADEVVDVITAYLNKTKRN